MRVVAAVLAALVVALLLVAGGYALNAYLASAPRQAQAKPTTIRTRSVVDNWVKVERVIPALIAPPLPLYVYVAPDTLRDTVCTDSIRVYAHAWRDSTPTYRLTVWDTVDVLGKLTRRRPSRYDLSYVERTITDSTVTTPIAEPVVLSPLFQLFAHAGGGLSQSLRPAVSVGATAVFRRVAVGYRYEFLARAHSVEVGLRLFSIKGRGKPP